jgi:hypothetical protein
MLNPFSTPDTSALSGATADDRARAAQFFRYLSTLQQNYQQALQQQQALGRSYDQVIAGTAPSVAGTQLQRTLGDTRNAVASEAAGASGQNAALANYGSIQALGGAYAKANQDAAALRAQEVANARAGKANLLQNEQGATGQQYGTTVGGATTSAGQATSGGGALANVNAEELGNERNLYSNLIKGAGAAIPALTNA